MYCEKHNWLHRDACPDCAEEYYGAMESYKKEKRRQEAARIWALLKEFPEEIPNISN